MGLSSKSFETNSTRRKRYEREYKKLRKTSKQAEREYRSAYRDFDRARDEYLKDFGEDEDADKKNKRAMDVAERKKDDLRDEWHKQRDRGRYLYRWLKSHEPKEGYKDDD